MKENTNKMNNRTVSIIFSNEKPIILNSYVDFRDWYLSRHDFSIFSQDDILAALEEEKPDHYPCIPIASNLYSEIFYLRLDNIPFI